MTDIEITPAMIEALQDALTMTLPAETLVFDGMPNFRPSKELAERALRAALGARGSAPPGNGTA